MIDMLRQISFDTLNNINDVKLAWVYILFSTIGVYSNIYWSIKGKKITKELLLASIVDLSGQLPFSWAVAICADNSPLLALIIGLLPDTVYNLFKNYGMTFIASGLKINMGSKNETTKDKKDEQN